MKTSDCIRAAKNDLANARRYLESGEAVNWVADNIGSVLNWAMEGWLIAKGHQISHGRGWDDTREAFLKNGPVNLRSQLMTLCAEATYLKFELMGDINTRSTLPMAEWETKAHGCLEKTEQAVHQLLAEIESDQDAGASHGR
jgi:hypothetical protein